MKFVGIRADDLGRIHLIWWIPPRSSGPADRVAVVTSSEHLLKAAARLKHSLEPLHAVVYFAPEAPERYAAVGLKPGRMTYFASRSAPFGPVGAGAVIATFYNFNP